MSMTYRHYLVNEGPISTLAQKVQHKPKNEKTRKRKEKPKHQQIEIEI